MDQNQTEELLAPEIREKIAREYLETRRIITQAELQDYMTRMNVTIGLWQSLVFRKAMTDLRATVRKWVDAQAATTDDEGAFVQGVEKHLDEARTAIELTPEEEKRLADEEAKMLRAKAEAEKAAAESQMAHASEEASIPEVPPPPEPKKTSKKKGIDPDSDEAEEQENTEGKILNV